MGKMCAIYSKVFISWTLALFVSIGHSYGQTTPIESFEYHEKSFKCTYAQKAMAEIETQDEGELEAQLANQIQEVKNTLEEKDLERSEKKLLKTHLHVLNTLYQSQNKKGQLHDFYLNLCQSSESIMKGFGKGLAHTSNIINQTVMFPFRFTFRFFKGLITGSSDTKKQITFHEAMGHKKGKSMAFFVLFQVFKIASSSTPYLTPIFVTPIIDVMAMGVCENKDSLNSKDQKFCENFLKIKNKFYKSAVIGQVWGAKLSPNQEREDNPIKKDWNEKVTEENLCEYLQFIKNSKTAGFKTDEFREVMLENLNPGNFSFPMEIPVRTPVSLMLKSSPQQVSKLRNIIVSLAPHEALVEDMKKNGSWDKYKETEKSVQKQKKIFGKLYRASDVNECLKRKDSSEFDYHAYEKLKAELRSFKLESFQAQHENVEAQMKVMKKKLNFTDRTKLNWEIIKSNTLNSVSELLSNPEVGNIIIITHSVGDFKKMIDSSFNQYPSTFFTNISSGLMSLSFYTCHSQDILKTYDIKARFEQSESIHHERALNFSQENQLMGGTRNTPLEGFKDFLYRVDRKLFGMNQKNMVAQALNHQLYSEPKTLSKCSIEISPVAIESGSLSIILNRQFIGNINKQESKAQFDFNCNLLKDENTVLLQNSALLSPLQLSQTPEAIFLKGREIENVSWKNFQTNEGHYSSSKIILKLKK